MSESDKKNKRSPKQLERMIEEKRGPIDLNGTQTAIFSKIAKLLNGTDSSLSPSLSYLSKITGFHRRTIQRSLKFLMEKKLLFKVKDYCPLTHSPNIYRINIDAFQNNERKSV